MKNVFRFAGVSLLVFGLIGCNAQGKGDAPSIDNTTIQKGSIMTIQKGSQVAFEYTLTVDGQVVDTSEGREAFVYTHGEGQIVPGLARQLEGLKVGDEKNIEVAPEEAYGPVNENAFQEVPRASLPADVELTVGMPLQVQNPQGAMGVVKIAEIKEDKIIIDFNHPLAGKTLNFQVKVASIK